MRTVIISRQSSGDEGTFGQLTADDGWKCFTGELPWRENLKGYSCVPPGAYTCQWLLSPTHGWCYHVTGVSGRSEIEIHSANFCGDRMLGKLCELRGCITLGKSIGKLKDQLAILMSKDTVQEFSEKMNRETFQLVIHGANQ